MATYFVRNDGNDNNVGTNPNAAGAWQTLTKALGASGISGGDTLYIAPGVYRETVTLGFASSGNTTYIYGDPKSLQFAGITPATVRITSNTLYDSLSSYFTPSSNTLISGTGKSNITMESMYLEYTYTGLAISSCSNIQLRNSVLTSHKFNWSDTFAISITQDTTLLPHRFENLISMGGTFTRYIPITSGVGLSGFMNVRNCLALGYRYYNSDTVHTLGSPITFNNCTFICSQDWALHTYGIGVGMIDVYNTFVWCNQYANVIWNGGNHMNYTNCRFSGVPQHHNTAPNKLVNCSYGLPGLDFAEQLLFGLSHTQFLSSKKNGFLAGVGTTTGIASSDLFGYLWQTPNPDIGAIQFRNLNSISSFTPSTQNYDSYNVFTNSTSQTFYIDLASIGVTYNTSGLSCFYIRDRSLPVQVPLVNQTPTGPWVSGGFCEVDNTNVPGVYRLDLPNAVLNPGVEKVLVKVRGGGINGSSLSIYLTENISNASIASTVWNTTNKIITGGAVSSVVNAVNITTNAMSGIANSVWTNTSRTLTQSFPANFANLSISAAGKVSVVQTDLDYITSNIPEVNYTNIASANWNYLMSGIATSGTFGYQIKVFLDARISSRSTLTSNQVLEANRKSTMTTSETNKEIFSKLP
jgi:hypothetical protein